MRSPFALAALVGVVQILAACAQNTAVAGAGAASAPVAPRTANTIDSTVIANAGDRPLAEIIASRIPGVRLARAADGSLVLHVRGESSFLNSSGPLYVIDGVQIEPDQQFNLASINPHDIASVEIVKDPSMLSMYGVRGANGVVIIRSKRPGS